MRLLSTGQVARMTGFSQQTIIRACDSGLLPCVKVPGSRSRRIYLSDLEEFARANGLKLETAEVLGEVR